MMTSKLTVPNNLMKTFRLWGGIYGGHFDILVLFKNKPTNRMANRNDLPRSNGKYVDTYKEHQLGNMFASMCPDTFETWFPGIDLKPYKPKDIEILYNDLFEVEITLPVDENDEPWQLGFHIDWK